MTGDPLRGRRTWWSVLLCSVVLCTPLALAVPAQASAPSTGAATAPFPATGYFTTGQLDGRSFFVTPTGEPFYSSGIDHVSPSPDTDRTTGQCPYCQTIAAEYPSTIAWAQATVTRLRSWGFNSLGPFSDVGLFSSQMPFSVQLTMASGDDWFTPSFVTHADAVAAAQVAPLADDPNLIGWYTDSELHWGPDGTTFQPVLDTYLALPATSPGHAVAEQYVGNPDGFLYALATRYFQVTTAAVRMYDPHHLILGVKATSQEIQPQLLEAAQPYVDVFSIDDYALQPGLAQAIDEAFPEYLPVTPTFASFEQYLHKPIMVGEYSFIAHTPKTPDTVPGLYAVYPTQTARAAAYTDYVAPLYEDSPWVVGDEWFEYVDEPQGGRFDGENDNFGVVDVTDQPYHPLVTQMSIMHSIAPDRAVQAGPTCDSWAAATSGVTCTATMPHAAYPLSVFSGSLPGATEGSAYSGYVVTIGGRPGYTFSLAPGQSLPPGLHIDPSSGVVSGTPSAHGQFSFVVRVTDSSTPPQSASRTVTIAVAPSPGATSPPGYDLAAADGGVFAFGSAGYYGSMGGTPLDAPVVGVAVGPTGKGYWDVASDGGVFAFGSAGYYGSMGGTPLDQPVVGIAAAPTGKGYWEVGADGGVFAFGSAGYYGSMGGTALDQPVVGIAAAPTGKGYWEVASDGGIFAFGSAEYVGSTGGKALDAPVVGIAPASA